VDQRVPTHLIGNDLAVSLERLFRWTCPVHAPAWIERCRGSADLAKRRSRGRKVL
jgi:hypothetical protein